MVFSRKKVNNIFIDINGGFSYLILRQMHQDKILSIISDRSSRIAHILVTYFSDLMNK